MSLLRPVTFAAVAALIAGAAQAQTPAPAAPAEAAAPAAEAAPPSAAAQAYKPIAPAGDLAATLAASGQFTKFLAAAEKAGLTGFIKTPPRPVTLIVPTDAALEGAGLEALTAEALRPILLYHVYTDKLPAAQIAGKKGPVPTAVQKNVEIDGSVTPMKVNDAVILQADVQATNGVIYVIDKPLTPPA